MFKKMKKNKIIFTLLIAGLGFGSCKKALDILPTDTFNESNAFQNIADLQAGLNGAYALAGGYNDVYMLTL